ncbi:MAG: 3'-5' exonuclease [Vicinamibacterales bacterium]
MNGVDGAKFSHIIVDEGQDVSPLHYATLRAYSANGSATVVGDVHQGLVAFRGVESWNEAERAFAPSAFTRHRITTSYRSTKQITELGNAILEQLDSPEGLAEPFPRDGVTPELITCAARDHIAVLVQQITRLRNAGHQNIGIVCRTTVEAQALHTEMSLTLKPSPGMALSRDASYHGGELILPLSLAKGLEFEAVILANGSRAAFGNTAEDLRLLYVAISRALHRLVIVSPGQIPLGLAAALGGPLTTGSASLP